MNMTSKEKREEISEVNPEALVADGFDDAIIGYAERIGQEPLTLYNQEKIIQILGERDGMTEEDAIEQFEYNIIGSYVGEHTPIFATLL